MGTDIDVLWVVTRVRNQGVMKPVQHKVFRTRAAAQKYVADKYKRSKIFVYYINRATWGPEQ